MQYGFRSKRGTVDAIVELLEQISNEKTHCEAILLDLTKAFDTVKISLLVEKLERYGIRGICLKLLQSYLESRKQYLQIFDAISETIPILHGVPQGSVLGPLLFIIYINDLPEVLKASHTYLFADDTALIKKGNKTHTDFQDDIGNIENWTINNYLVINPKKSKYLCFSTNKVTNKTVNICCKTIKNEKFAKYLGVLIDDKFSFLEHVSYVCKKISIQGGLIRQMKDILIRDHILLFYNAYIKLRIQYAILAYGNCKFTQIDDIVNIQKRIVRTIFSVKKFASVSQIMIQNKIYTAHELYVYELLKTIVKNKTKICAGTRTSKLLEDDSQNTYLTRYKTKGLLSESSCPNKSFSVLKSRIRKLYNILIKNDLLPENLHNFTKYELNQFYHRFRDNYILGNFGLIKYIFK